MTPNTDAAQAEATIKGYHAYFATQPPFLSGAQYALPQGLSIIELPPSLGGLKSETFAELYERVGAFLAQRYASGDLKDFAHHHDGADPAPEVWVSGRSAAVLSGWSATQNGGAMAHSVALSTLHKLPSGMDDGSGGNPWRLTGMYGGPHLPPGTPRPAVQTADDDMISSFQTLLASIEGQDWDAVSKQLLPGGGATAWTDGATESSHVTYRWPEYVEHLRAEAASGGGARKKEILGCETRRWENLGFVWAPFEVVGESGASERGVIACALKLVEGRWLIAGLQESLS